MRALRCEIVKEIPKVLDRQWDKNPVVEGTSSDSKAFFFEVHRGLLLDP